MPIDFFVALKNLRGILALLGWNSLLVCDSSFQDAHGHFYRLCNLYQASNLERKMLSDLPRPSSLMIHRQQAAQKLCLQGFAKIIIVDDVYKKNLQVDIKAARSTR